MIHATVFFRQKWAVVMLDSSAACTIGNSLAMFNFWYIIELTDCYWTKCTYNTFIVNSNSSCHRPYFSLSVAYLSAPSSFDGVILHWRTPKVMTPLVLDLSGFVSRSIELGVNAQLMNETTRTAMGYMLGEDGQVVHISVPFGASGGYSMYVVQDTIQEVCARQTSNQCCVFFAKEKERKSIFCDVFCRA